MKLTYVDAAVLIAAARGGSEQAARALEILDDPERQYRIAP
jgi:predicted nucleic acid-binding protein